MKEILKYLRFAAATIVFLAVSAMAASALLPVAKSAGTGDRYFELSVPESIILFLALELVLAAMCYGVATGTGESHR